MSCAEVPPPFSNPPPANSAQNVCREAVSDRPCAEPPRCGLCRSGPSRSGRFRRIARHAGSVRQCRGGAVAKKRSLRGRGCGGLRPVRQAGLRPFRDRCRGSGCDRSGSVSCGSSCGSSCRTGGSAGSAEMALRRFLCFFGTINRRFHTKLVPLPCVRSVQ